MHTTKYMPFIRKKAAYWKKILRNTWIRHWRLPNLSSRNINLCTANSKLQSWYVSEPVSVLCKKRIYTGKMFAQYECVILVCIKLRCMRYFVFFLTPFSQEITNYRNICSEEIKTQVKNTSIITVNHNTKHSISHRAVWWSLRTPRLESDSVPLDVLCCLGTG